MKISEALELADKALKNEPMTDEVLALRVLAGAYRREKKIKENLQENNRLKKRLDVYTDRPNY